MKHLSVFLVFVFLSALCRAQSTSHPPGMDDVQISISLTNNIIPVGSAFSIFAEMKNTSTNIVTMGGSSPEKVFSVFLTSASGTIYQISPAPVRITISTERYLNPGETHAWTIPASVNRYFEPPGFTPTNTNVPAGNYTLKIKTKIATRYGVFNAESNWVKIEIK